MPATAFAPAETPTTTGGTARPTTATPTTATPATERPRDDVPAATVTAGRAGGQPSVHRRAVLTWLAVYPTITVVLALVGPPTAALPLPVRTLILTGIVIPAVVYGIAPLLNRAVAAVEAAVAAVRRGRR
ncbi:hypothetical protein [Yinghuangia seranimata]|uniref:hypothetical protein n=1 Tax=Yinghuangia seranimata TaxID=408067 RepID=UPI00248C183C|nr:hypothetical protein [Yinghuangia seranimata]MDI2127710.1 hypothetical protein [Yinghuangia seranimata]